LGQNTWVESLIGTQKGWLRFQHLMDSFQAERRLHTNRRQTISAIQGYSTAAADAWVSWEVATRSYYCSRIGIGQYSASSGRSKPPGRAAPARAALGLAGFEADLATCLDGWERPSGFSPPALATVVV
jgi:hypothetical protein